MITENEINLLTDCIISAGNEFSLPYLFFKEHMITTVIPEKGVTFSFHVKNEEQGFFVSIHNTKKNGKMYQALFDTATGMTIMATKADFNDLIISINKIIKKDVLMRYKDEYSMIYKLKKF